MKLLKLEIKNFKKIAALTIEADGKNVEIRGENGTGKTTVYDAYSWCLFGKSGLGNSVESQIKLKDSMGKASTDGGIEHSVTIEMALDNGEIVSLQRTYMEIWTKKRGQAQAEFSGHTTDYKINGVPVQKKNFTEYVNEIGNEETFKLLSMPLYFCVNINWKDRRKILLQVCGDVTDTDVISSNMQLAKLPKIIGTKSIDDFRKIISARKKEINKELDKIPARIDELQRQLSSDDQMQSKETLEIEIASLKKQQESLEKQIIRIENGGEIAEKKKQIAEIEAQRLTMNAKFDAQYSAGVGQQERKLKDLQADKAAITKQIATLENRKKILSGTIETAVKKMDDLRQAYMDKAAVEYVSQVENICPTCGQEIPAEQKVAAEEKALQEFNLKKSDGLAQINAAGKEEKKRMLADQAVFDDYDADIKNKQIKLAELSACIDKLHDVITNEVVPDVHTDVTYQRLLSQQSAIQDEIEMIKSNVAVEISKIKTEILVLTTDINSRQNKIAQLDNLKAIHNRIAELKEREALLGKEFSEVESEIFMTEEFIRSKVSLLEEKINSKFKIVSFKLFDTKINGALEECCDPMINGVPFTDGLNTGSCMMAAIDIVNVLSDHYGVHLPVFIDNCEAYTSLMQTENQMITLYADAKYKKLNVEVNS